MNNRELDERVLIPLRQDEKLLEKFLTKVEAIKQRRKEEPKKVSEKVFFLCPAPHCPLRDLFALLSFCLKSRGSNFCNENEPSQRMSRAAVRPLCLFPSPRSR
jgi:hypothetical protein